MIIAVDSPLRRLPANLDPRQSTFLDGLRLSVEMCDVAYERLSCQLWESTSNSEEVVSIARGIAAAVMLDVWSIVDSVHRIRSILDAMPGFKKSGPTYQLFVRATDRVTALRNTVQHFREELATMAEQATPVWGVLSWMAVIKPDGTEVRSYVLDPGRTQSGTHRLLNPAGQVFRTPIDHVTLTSKNEHLSLSDLVDQTEKVIRPIEASLEKQFPGAPVFRFRYRCVHKLSVPTSNILGNMCTGVVQVYRSNTSE